MVKKHSHGPAHELESLLEQLRASHLRVTTPRMTILEALVNNHGPFTAEQIHALLPKKSCDLVTVYRTVASLEKARVIRRCEFGDGSARYELAVNNEHHHHVICKECKRVEVLDDCDLANIDRFAQRRGFSDVSHSLEFFGICPRCK